MTFVLPKRVDYTGYKSDTFIERFIVMCLHISRSGRSAWYSVAWIKNLLSKLCKSSLTVLRNQKGSVVECFLS